MRVLFAGDLHGNTPFARYLARTARAKGADVVVQVGDFGYWEHEHDGVVFLDDVAAMAAETEVPWVFVDGNHDKHALLLDSYHDVDADGFVVVRDGLGYAPRGHRWTWAGTRFAALGGAYSVDKPDRLRSEADRRYKAERKEAFRRRAGRPPKPVPDFAGTEWFPEEEIADAEVAALVVDPTPVDVLVTHDKPRAAAPGWNRKDLPECWPNQDRVSAAVRALTPRLLVHGHLHYRYTDWVRVGAEAWTRVEGLAGDDATKKDTPGWRPDQAWLLVDLPAGLDALCAAPAGV